MSLRNRWARRSVVVALAVGVLVVFARVEHTTPLLLPTVLLVGMVVAILGMVTDSQGIDPPRWRVGVGPVRTGAGQDSGLATNVRLLENNLTARQADPQLKGRLARLADDRLAQVGLRRGDPGVAARLGPTLTAVLDGPPRTLRLDEVEECIRRIEELTP